MPQPKLDIVFRVGVTGSTGVAVDPQSALWVQIRGVVRDLRSAVTCAAQDDSLQGIRSDAPALLRVLSPLAEGADRLFASASLDIEDSEPDPHCVIRLEAILPFAQVDYESTFAKDTPARNAESVESFRALLARANGRALELDGAVTPDAARHASYRDLGRTVVRNCDLLIAIWHPEQQSKGPGGTRDTAHYAVGASVPVLQLDPSGQRLPQWLNPGDAPSEHVQDPTLAMREYVRNLLRPPQLAEDRAAWGIRVIRRLIGERTDPLRSYLAEDDLHNFNIWRARDAILGPLHRRGARTEGFDVAPDRGNHWLFRCYRRYRPQRASSSFAAQLSTKYQQRYRTSYFAILITAALTLVIAASSAGGHAPVWLIASEFGLLLSIAGIWMANGIFEWHQRYISYRILAELLRATRFLQSTARTAPGSRLGQASTGSRRWLAWAYSSMVRATPLETGAITADRKDSVKSALLTELIESQIQYHRRRRAECAGTSSTLASIALTLFVVTLLIVAIKLVIHVDSLKFVEDMLPKLPAALGLIVVVLPVVAAALFSLRSYEEFELLVDQSELIIEELEEIRTAVERIETDRPLSLQDLGVQTLKVAQLLLSDVREWAQVFKLKAVEG